MYIPEDVMERAKWFDGKCAYLIPDGIKYLITENREGKKGIIACTDGIEERLREHNKDIEFGISNGDPIMLISGMPMRCSPEYAKSHAEIIKIK